MTAIRVDGNSKIGMGHIMRCLSVAKALKAIGTVPVFITAGSSFLQIIKSADFNCIQVGSEFNTLDKEIPLLLKIIKENDIKAILVDSYFVTHEYLSFLQSYVKLCYIDDMFMFVYPVDMIINYNIDHGRFDYKSSFPKVKLLLGGCYVPLREEFSSIKPIAIKKTISEVLVTTGATDPLNICKKLIEKIVFDKRLNYIKFNFIAGRFFNNLEELKVFHQNYSNITILDNVKSMSEIMLRCDLAISAGGTTLYELCACGLPTIAFSFVDNQDGAIRQFSESKAMITLGRWFDGMESKIIDKILFLLGDQNLRINLSKRVTQITDGKGAMRIASELVKLGTSS